jgi:hypothetical protein
VLHVLAAYVLLDVLAACVPMNLHACISKDNSIGEHKYARDFEGDKNLDKLWT